MNAPWISVIGLGPDGAAGLTASARDALSVADHVVCAERHEGLVQDLVAGKEVHHWPAWHRAKDVIAPLEGQKVAVLGTGEPFHFGVGTSLVRWFGVKALRVFPATSAFDRACARLGLAQQDVDCLSAYGRSLGAVLVRARVGQTALILGDGELGPKLKDALTVMGLGASQITALSQMDGAAESRVDAQAKDWSESVDPITTWAVTYAADAEANGNWPGLRFEPFGLPDEAFKHDGKITKREVRSASLSALLAAQGGSFWDIGGGSGAIGLEWLRARPSGQVFTIEPHGERRGFIEKNAKRFGLGHDERDPFTVSGAHAPDAYQNAPFSPDAVFVGGGLTREGVLDGAWEALNSGGVLVANAVTLEGQAVLTGWRERVHGDFATLAIARGESVGRFIGLRPLMPVLQWVGRKP
ncbi:MAG: precorrin-6Y C5,15-methyltransferase (decarboxylating) subunit CbiT [Alphaproteobacteria bacterium]